MRLVKISIENFRSIKRVEARLESLQAFVGENNAGKSNILKAIACFLTAGAGNVQRTDFNDPAHPVKIEAEFTNITPFERARLRPYMIGDKIILQKVISIQEDPRTGKPKVVGEYHGYQAEPQDWWLSLEKIEAREGARPNWREIAEQNGILDYVISPDGRVNKSSYKEGLQKLLSERDDVQYDTPVLGNTQALGVPQNLLGALPDFYLLPAITDYSDEIDKRSSTTVFRRLMSDLSDRIIRTDPKYAKIEAALGTIRELLNTPPTGQNPERMESLALVEGNLTSVIAKLMPSVRGVKVDVSIEEPREMFSRGVSLQVDDGVMTDVLDKGNGLQRSVIFGLLQMLIETDRLRNGQDNQRPIILGIEEPELYIHPQCQRLIYNVLKDFSGSREEAPTGFDQVIYTTHSPSFLDLSNYERIGVVRKTTPQDGTVVKQCGLGTLNVGDERKTFKILTSFGLKQNELFFARNIILVEGPEDEVGIIATGRKLGRFKELPEEIGVSVVVTGGKGEIPKFQKVLHAFGFSYSVLVELDGNPEEHPQTAPILQSLHGNVAVKIPSRLEDVVRVGRHFDDQLHAKKFFSNVENINADIEAVVTGLLPADPTFARTTTAA